MKTATAFVALGSVDNERRNCVRPIARRGCHLEKAAFCCTNGQRCRAGREMGKMHRPTRTHVACHMHGESRFIGPNEVPNRPLRRRRADTPPCWHAAPAHRTLPCLASPANLAALLKLLNEGITVRLAAPYRGGVQPAYLCAICQCVHTTPTTDTQTSPTRLQRWDLPRITPHAVASPRASKHADTHVHRGVLVRSPTARDGHPHRCDL